MAAERRGLRASLSLRRAIGVVALVMLASTACRVDAPPTGASAEEPLAAKAAGGGPGAASVAVTSTDPAAAPFDTTLDVSVYGTGFTTGARAVWSLAGDTTKVHVLSTKLVSSGRLVARIQI